MPNSKYRQDGCAVHPTCQDCPITPCIYDRPSAPGAVLSINHWRRRALPVRRMMERLMEEGIGKAEAVRIIAEKIRVSERTVYRAMVAVDPTGAGSNRREEGERS